eukprot:NODE_253_length_11722_cov_0.375118.p10 type:complete len:200 gc:universal NODE_253_length_11722_cov_0.375118:3982-3383(-)
MALFIPSMDTKIKAIVEGQLIHDLNLPIIKNKTLDLNRHHNVHVAKKYDNYLKDKLSEKILNVKSIVDTSPPKYMRHPSSSKKLQMEKDRNRDIERQNMKLYHKIQSIQPSIPKPSQSSQLMENRLKMHRQKQQDKIELENVKIQQRIDKARNKPVSTHWKDERKQNLDYLKNIARYPKKFYVEAEILNHKSTKLEINK